MLETRHDFQGQPLDTSERMESSFIGERFLDTLQIRCDRIWYRVCLVLRLFEFVLFVCLQKFEVRRVNQEYVLTRDNQNAFLEFTVCAVNF